VQHATRQTDIHPLQCIVQHGWVYLYQSPQPARKIRMGSTQYLNGGRCWNGLSCVQRDFNPAGNGFLGLNHGLFQSVPSRKAARQVRDHHTPGGGVISRFNGNGETHIVRLSNAGLPPDSLYQPVPQVLLGVRHHDMARARQMLEDVMGAIHPVQLPTSTLHLAYQVGACHFVCMLHTIGYLNKLSVWEMSRL